MGPGPDSCHHPSRPVSSHQSFPALPHCVIVVCVSFLVFMIILGVFRIRAAHQRTMRDQDTGKKARWTGTTLT